MRGPRVQRGVELEQMWPERFAPNWDKLEKSKSEHPFGEASFELLKEAATISTLAAGLIPKEPLERNEAILCGLVVKVSKLGKAILAMTAHLGGDRQLALLRELNETLATLHHLLGDPGDGRRFDQYVQDSLVSEREFLKHLNENVNRRGAPLPIEKSMARSIERTARAAGIDDVRSLPGREKIGWPSAEVLLEGLGGNLYPAYRTGSAVLHSQWLDLLRHHLLRREDGRFEPNFDEVDPRPQPLYAAGILLVRVTREYLDKVHPGAMGEFGNRLDDLEARLTRVFEMHGSFLDKE